MRRHIVVAPLPVGDGAADWAVTIAEFISGWVRSWVRAARSFGCSYRGTETIDGSGQFALDRPLPNRYASDKRASGVFGRFFAGTARK